MGDRTRNFFHISYSQENYFLFEGELEQFKSHLVPKNVELSKIERKPFKRKFVFQGERKDFNTMTCYQKKKILV